MPKDRRLTLKKRAFLRRAIWAVFAKLSSPAPQKSRFEGIPRQKRQKTPKKTPHAGLNPCSYWI
jgi:hypothetical protein